MEFLFETNSVKITALDGKKVVASKPDSSGDLFVLLDDTTLAHINLESKELVPIADLRDHKFPIGSAFELHCSDDNRFIALTCTYRGSDGVPPLSAGVVLSVTGAKEVMGLSNGDCHTEQAPFPLCFITHEGRNLLVHATDWNRLDITDLETGELLTERDFAEKPDLPDEEEFVFTEWPGKLLPSPDQGRVATIGWVWHPIGHAYSFDLKRWLEGHKWESDASLHQRSYTIWDYFWDSPFVWIDDQRLCIWGVDEDSLEPSNCVAIFDASTGEKMFSFKGPTINPFIYDRFLFSGIDSKSGGAAGLSIWDVSDGKLLHLVPDFTFDIYCYKTHRFIQFCENGNIVVSTWSHGASPHS